MAAACWTDCTAEQEEETSHRTETAKQSGGRGWVFVSRWEGRNSGVGGRRSLGSEGLRRRDKQNCDRRVLLAEVSWNKFCSDQPIRGYKNTDIMEGSTSRPCEDKFEVRPKLCLLSCGRMKPQHRSPSQLVQGQHAQSEIWQHFVFENATPHRPQEGTGSSVLLIVLSSSRKVEVGVVTT